MKEVPTSWKRFSQKSWVMSRKRARKAQPKESKLV